MGEVTVLSIGMTHPWNIAGVGLDLRIGAELGVRVFTVVAAVSAQDAQGVRLQTINGETLRAQLDTIPWDRVRAVRVGAVTSPETAYVIADALSVQALPVVIDPVFASSTGGTFAGPGTIDAFRDALLPTRGAIITPNLDEAMKLVRSHSEITSVEQAATAATMLRDLGAAAVLVKGGHLPGEPVDVLVDGDRTELFSGERIAGEMRGTGCTLAMALACALARGDDLRDAVRFARGFVREKIAQANL